MKKQDEKEYYLKKLKDLKQMLSCMIDSNIFKHNIKIEMTNYGLILSDNTPDTYCRLIISSARAKDDIKYGDYREAYDTIYETLKYYPDIRNDLRSLCVLRDVLEEVDYNE